LTTEEIAELYTPTDEEVAFVKERTRQPPQQLALLIALKCVQRLGYFPLLPDVPMAVQTFLCDALHLPFAPKRPNSASTDRLMRSLPVG
jgi:hypothetical protein